MATQVTGEYIELENVSSAPGTPATDKIRLYADGDTLKQKDDAGTVTSFGSGGGGLFESYAIIAEEYTSGTSGGGATSATYNARTMNTVVDDPDSIVTLSSGDFTLEAGDYLLEGWSSAYRTNESFTRLYNVTQAAAVESKADTIMTDSGGSTIAMKCPIVVAFTSNGTDAYRLETYTTTGGSTNRLGRAVSVTGVTERYVLAKLWKKAD